MNRDYDSICTRCGKTGHRAANCPLPIARHVVEPYDPANDRMVLCADCVRAAVARFDYQRRRNVGCPAYIPSMANVPQHCGWFRAIPAHASPQQSTNRSHAR